MTSAYFNRPPITEREDALLRAARALAAYGPPTPGTAPKTNRLAIVMEGGLVQSVLSDDPALRSVEVFVVDYDTNGETPATAEGVMEITYDDGKGDKRTEHAFIRLLDVGESGIDLSAVEAFTKA